MSNRKTKTRFPENFGLHLDELSQFSAITTKTVTIPGEPGIKSEKRQFLNFGEHFLSGWVISSVKGDNREIMQPGIAGVFR